MRKILLVTLLFVSSPALSAKIVVNNTGLDVLISDTGITVPASGQHTITSAENTLFAGSNDLISLLGDDTLKINDGSTDLSDSDGLDLIKGIFPRPPPIDFSELKFKKVAASEIDETGCVVIPNGQKIAMYRIRMDGDPETSVRIVWDHDGGAEKIFGSTEGDVDSILDVDDTVNQITGDGTKKMCVIIENNSPSQSEVRGGSWEATKK